MPIDFDGSTPSVDWSSYGVRSPNNVLGLVAVALLGGPAALLLAYLGVGFAQSYIEFLFNIVGA